METVAETGSTNDDMMARARGGAAEGLWIRAERQTSGRGRQGRAWASDTGNLSASTLVRLRPGDPPAPTLALVGAVALHEALTVAVPELVVRIKWPNDLMAGEAKLSGILLERQGDAVVMGFGANLSHAPIVPDRLTTSVRELVGGAPEPGAFLEILAEMLAGWIATWRSAGLPPIRQRWLAHAHPVGTGVRVRSGDGYLDGLFDGLASDGSLLLRTAEGVRAVHAGDVSLL
ncbi:biotin--[acetyl-CoA-carboxylase] ligase [Sphingomonas prati]|uniref:biotin--[acetyl-CoA-carboxylase] ligase n=1 Tax=Sphingomonas prati TaxID=1843237 RepID=UPI0012F6DE30|nr:biotin--[acetyl-CoA-carboxylase] ligase [Sphingomonas prati]